MDTSFADRSGASLAILPPLALLALLSLPAAAAPQRIEVAAGSGDFTTTQAAIDHAPAEGKEWTVILVDGDPGCASLREPELALLIPLLQ